MARARTITRSTSVCSATNVETRDGSRWEASSANPRRFEDAFCWMRFGPGKDELQGHPAGNPSARGVQGRCHLLSASTRSRLWRVQSLGHPVQIGGAESLRHTPKGRRAVRGFRSGSGPRGRRWIFLMAFDELRTVVAKLESAIASGPIVPTDAEEIRSYLASRYDFTT